MANPTWPAGVGSRNQKLPLGANIAPVDTRGGFQPDAGPAILYPLTTEDPDTITLSRPMVMTSAERNVLVEFIRTDLVGGALPFDWVDPWPGAGTLTFQFPKGGLPTYNPIGAAGDRGGRAEQALYAVTFTLIRWPWYPPAQVG